jgi:hypothetical protein
MKTIICFLFPVLLLAQNSLPDTLVLIDGRTFPCLITSMSDAKVDMIYSNNKNETVVLKAITFLNIENLGMVYMDEHGITMELDKINLFLENRMQQITDNEMIQQDLLKLSVVSGNEQTGVIGSNQLTNLSKQFEMKKWSFGVLFIPYYSGRIYEIIYYSGSYPPEFYTGSFATNEINMQGQLAYAPASNFMLTLDVTYTSSYTERSSESHTRSQYYEYDSGIKTTDGLYLFDFSLGVKYYLLKFLPGNVNIYALAGFGKQFASADASQENLFPDPGPVPIVDDNLEEYLEGLNSPWHMDFGFGVEYLFNESLSLNSNIRFIYASVSSEYDYRYVSEFETNTQSIEYSNSEFLTRIGLGLNFYF